MHRVMKIRAFLDTLVASVEELPAGVELAQIPFTQQRESAKVWTVALQHNDADFARRDPE